MVMMMIKWCKCFYVRLTRSEWFFVSSSVTEIHIASRGAGPRETNATRPVRRAVVITQVFVWIRKRLFCYHSTETLSEHIISTRHVNKLFCNIQCCLLSFFLFSRRVVDDETDRCHCGGVKRRRRVCWRTDPAGGVEKAKQKPNQ